MRNILVFILVVFASSTFGNDEVQQCSYSLENGPEITIEGDAHQRFDSVFDQAANDGLLVNGRLVKGRKVRVAGLGENKVTQISTYDGRVLKFLLKTSAATFETIIRVKPDLSEVTAAKFKHVPSLVARLIYHKWSETCQF